jgi:hypothetical protein
LYIYYTMPTTITPPSATEVKKEVSNEAIAAKKEVKHQANTVLENGEEVLDELVHENGMILGQVNWAKLI